MNWNRALIERAEKLGWIKFPPPKTYKRCEVRCEKGLRGRRVQICDCGSAATVKFRGGWECSECHRKNNMVKHHESTEVVPQRESGDAWTVWLEKHSDDFSPAEPFNPTQLKKQ